jgi:prepilin-type processing-associated H-X9-DG protein
MYPAGKAPNPANTLVKPGFQNLVFDCLGYLYETKLIGDGKILYCPGFPSSSLFSPSRFSNPSFMSTDNYGVIEDTMLFNPQIDDPLCTNTSVEASPRLFPKTSSLVSGRLFGMDSVQIFTNNMFTLTISGFGPNTFAHYPSRGFNVLFTDGSVRFVQNRLALDMVIYGLPGDNGSLPPPFVYGIAGRTDYEYLFGFLEDRYPPTPWDWDGGGHYP